MRTSSQNRNEQAIAPSPLCISISSKRHNRRIPDIHSGKLHLATSLAIHAYKDADSAAHEQEKSDRQDATVTFISYAQNFEDIRLWRALKHYENGFYIDVGANQPVLDSVTKAFYEHGWSGINIEPLQVYHEALCQDRPKDINLQCVAGETAEALTFYAIAGTGMSTLEPSVAKERLEAGMDVRSQTVQSVSYTHLTLPTIYSV